jgi:hypothetical protein
MGVFETDQAADGKVMIIRSDGLFDLGGIDNAPDPLEAVKLD